MFTLIKNGYIYAPEELGKKDLLLAADKIAEIDDTIQAASMLKDIHIIDADGKFVVPGFIDPHVHILGGGGEGGFRTRTAAIKFTDITTAGITTVVGCLGTDGFGRSLASLIAKARALEEDGISTYLYVGSYQFPVTTITGSVENDIMLIDKFIGVGEIALSDHRSSQPTLEDVIKLAAAARVAGLLSGKAGIVHFHIGGGKRKLSYLEKIVKTTEIPITQFYPTHINRNLELFENGIEYAKQGGYVDLTTSTAEHARTGGEVKCSSGLKMMLQRGVSSDNITFSSDGQGSLPAFNEKGECVGLSIGKCDSLFREVRDVIYEEKIDIAIALKVITSNPARILKLSSKGALKKGFDADVVLLDQKTFAIDTVIAKGVPVILNNKTLRTGTFGE